MNVSRRTLLLTMASAGAWAALPTLAQAAAATAFTLPPLPYAPSALEPSIDAQTMKLHHDKHHATYVKNLNAALARVPGPWNGWKLEALLQKLDQLPAELQLPVRNNAGGHWNHSFFWKTLEPVGRSKPSARLQKEVAATFGSWKSFQEAFNQAALNRFGSGWAWLSRDKAGKLQVTSTPNQDTPVSQGWTPLLGVDVWEHAYYLKYQNKRKDYVEAFWNVINWTEVERRAYSK